MYELLVQIYRIFLVMMLFDVAKMFIGGKLGIELGMTYYIAVILLSAILLLGWRRYKEKVRAFLSVIVLLCGFAIIMFPISLSHLTYVFAYLFGISCAFMDKSLHHGVRILTAPIRWMFKDVEIKEWHFFPIGLLYIPFGFMGAILVASLINIAGYIAPELWYEYILPFIFLGNIPEINTNIPLAILATYAGFIFGVSSSYAISYLTGGEIMGDVEPMTYAYPEMVAHNLKFVEVIIYTTVLAILPISLPPIKAFLEIIMPELGDFLTTLVNTVTVICILLVIGVILHASRGRDVVFGEI